MGTVLGRDSGVGRERQIGRAGHRRRQYRRREADDGRDLGGTEWCRGRNVGGDVAVVAGPHRADDDVQVAVEEPAVADRWQHHRAVERQGVRARAGRAQPDHRRWAEDHGAIRTGERPCRQAAPLGHRVRLQGGQAVALSMPAVSRQRRAEEHSGASAPRGDRRQQRSGAALARRCHQMRIARLLAIPMLVIVLAPAASGAALDASDTTWDGTQPPDGVYFHWYEPSFYAGFAPRTQDPRRIHIQLSRGNQVRVTLVLGDADIDNYLGDLVLRQTTYQELIDAKVIELTTNRDYERFVDKLGSTGLAEVVKSRERLPVDAYRKKSVELMSLLNPERVFQIRFPVDGVLKAWHDKVAALAANDLSAKDKQLDTINALLPGRINLYEMS